MRRKHLLLLLILPVLLCSSGCGSSSLVWANYRQLEQLQLTQTIGIDRDGAGVCLSISTGKPMEGEAPMRMSQAAPSLQLAMNRLQNYTANASLFYAHTRYVVIGQSAAETGIAPYLDFVERDVAMRLSAPLFIVYDATAQHAILNTGGEKTDITENLSALEQDVSRQGNGHAFTCGEIAQGLASAGSALACAVVCVPSKEQNAGDETILPYGYGILKDGKLAGFLPGELAIGVNVLLNLGGHGDVLLQDAQGAAVTVALDTTKAGFTPVWNDDGSLQCVEVSVTARAAITELSEPQEITNPAYLDQLDQALADTLRGWIEAILSQSQTLQADFLGIGQQIATQSPNKWTKIRPDWNRILPETAFRISVTGLVERTFDLQDSIGVTGGAS